MADPVPPTGSAYCAACGAPRSPGARFCHRCGTPAGEAGPAVRLREPWLPWAIAAVAVTALLAFIAGQGFARRSAAAPPAAVAAPAGPATPGGAGPAPAPDISRMSPQERADRLFDRVMRYASEGKPDSARFFAPMALASLEAIEPRTLHHRYDIGLIGLVTGDAALAAAQADTILAEVPTHLLGLALAAQAAEARRDSAARAGFLRRLLAAEPAERRTGRPEYTDHANDIEQALAAARRPAP